MIQTQGNFITLLVYIFSETVPYIYIIIIYMYNYIHVQPFWAHYELLMRSLHVLFGSYAVFSCMCKYPFAVAKRVAHILYGIVQMIFNV